MSAEKPRITILEQRRIEAGIVKPIYDVLVQELGTERARALIGEAIRRAARQAGETLSEEFGGATTLLTFARVLDRWKEGDAYEMEVLAETDRQFDFNIRRCGYAEMYKKMGLGEIGHLLSCQRDGALCEGYDPKIKMTRTQTIMQGGTHCDFRFSYQEESASQTEVKK